MLVVFHTREIQPNANAVERNILRGVNDAREFAVGVIILNGCPEVQMTRIKLVGVNQETHWYFALLLQNLNICVAMCLNK